MLPDKLAAFPRLPLANFPTPLEHLPGLSSQLGREIYIKRDDVLGPGLGGNKTRKLEFLLAEALESQARRVVTFGGLQSNHARLTAATALRVGLEPHLLYFERRPEVLTGNLLLNQWLGAHLHFFPLGRGGDGSLTLETTIRLVRLLARLVVGRHHFIPVGGHSWRGCLGYVQAALEIHIQAQSQGLTKARLVLAAGTGGTLAGLWAGLTLIGSPVRLIGIDVGRLWKRFPASIARLAGEISQRLAIPAEFQPDQVPLLDHDYAGQGYGVPSPAGLHAMLRLARSDGVLLDPIYTAKAFAGLLDLAENGPFPDDEALIFLHTGGLPGLFAFGGDLANEAAVHSRQASASS